MTTRTNLKARLQEDRLLVVPGVYEMISALMADRMGFEALYMTGFGTVATHLGLPDAGLATYTDMVGRVSQICGRTQTPLIADADTGYGGLLNVRETVRGYEAAGAVGIQIEDQEFPKKCGHTPGRRVIPIEDMVRKIQVACDARRHDETLIVARTDARTGLGLDEALRRGEAFAKAGADVLFIESPESEAEMERVCKSFDTPCLANMADGGKTPILSRERLEEIGYRVAIYPGTAFLAAAKTYQAVYEAIQRDGSSVNIQHLLYPFPEMTKLMGFEDVWDFDRRWAAE